MSLGSIESCFRPGKGFGKQALPSWPPATAAPVTVYFSSGFLSGVFLTADLFVYQRMLMHLTLHNLEQTAAYVSFTLTYG